jgi:hypothetical protein
LLLSWACQSCWIPLPWPVGILFLDTLTNTRQRLN